MNKLNVLPEMKSALVFDISLPTKLNTFLSLNHFELKILIFVFS